MKRKIIGMLVCALLIATLLPITGTVVARGDSQEAVLKTTPLRKFFIFGIMERIDTGENIEFQITSFALIIGGGENQILTKGEMIRIYGPMIGISTNTIFIGMVSDWSIIG